MSAGARILLADDDGGIREAMSAFLLRAGYRVAAAPDGEAALRMIDASPFEMVVSDLKMPKVSGVELLAAVRGRGIAVPFILLTAYGTIETAVSAMKQGASDFLLKPFQPSQLERAIRDCLAGGAARAQALPRGAGAADGSGIVAESRAMRDVLAMARHVAGGRATVLITGESGTGKEVVARFIHDSGPDPSAPFVAVNCAAIPENLLESELFGHEKGAFTGASARRIGKFEMADGGTLLLDEIGEMDIRLQAKLLRALQERSFERVGGSERVSVRLRVIATTNRNLRDAVAEGRFREDLYYRVNVIPIVLSPLRERPEDIAPLARAFARAAARENGCAVPSFTDDALRFLEGLPCRGNARELMNRVERAVLVCGDRPIDARRLAEPGEEPSADPRPASAAPAPPAVPAVPGSVREAEKTLILSTLRRTGGNRGKAAAELGISVRTLRNKISAYRRSGEAIP